jgi:hypothetical protein
MQSKILISICTLSIIAGTLFLLLHPIKATSLSKQYTTSSVETRSSSTTQEIEINNIYTLSETNPTEAISALKKFIKTEPSYMNQCHEIAHEIGHRAYTHFNEQAFAFKDPFCGAGYLHGLLEEATIFDGTMSLKDMVHTVCSGEIEESCLHGLGHAIYKSVHDIPKSITYCNKVMTKNKDCYDGVYMELFDTETATGTLSANDATNICITSSEQAKASCFFYLPRILKHAPPKDATSFCSSLPTPDDQKICAQGSGVMFMKYAEVFEIEAVTKECELYTSAPLKQTCITGVHNYYTYGNVTNTEW